MDNADGMRQVVEHLVGLGHRQIGAVAGPRSSWSSRERLRGLRAATVAAGVELTEIGSFAPTFEGGLAAADGALLAGVTAVVAYNDLVALGLLSALRDRGVDVPGRLSLVGVDNVQMSAMVHPALTTLDIPKERAGRASVDLLLRLLADPSAGTSPVRPLPTALLVRHTTGPALGTDTGTGPAPTPKPSGRRRTSRR
jgi:DNA-binding LacI/PurR family transcriptional regulator